MEENGAQIMQMALLSVDNFIDKDQSILKQKKDKDCKNFYELTDEEAILIANKRIFGHNYTFVKPILQRSFKDDHTACISISNENDLKEPTRVQMLIKPYSGDFMVNNNQYFDDGNLRALIARAFVKKYGEAYRISYAGYWTRLLQMQYQKYGDLPYYAKKLDRRLSAIEKRAPNSKMLILGTYRYSFLQDLPEAETQNWVIAQEQFFK